MTEYIEKLNEFDTLLFSRAAALEAKASEAADPAETERLKSKTSGVRRAQELTSNFSIQATKQQIPMVDRKDFISALRNIQGTLEKEKAKQKTEYTKAGYALAISYINDTIRIEG